MTYPTACQTQSGDNCLGQIYPQGQHIRSHTGCAAGEREGKLYPLSLPFLYPSSYVWRYSQPISQSNFSPLTAVWAIFSVPWARIALLIHPLRWYIQIFWLGSSHCSINISILYTGIDPMGLHGTKCQGYLKKNVELETSNRWSLFLKSLLAKINSLHLGYKWSRCLLSRIPHYLIAILISH